MPPRWLTGAAARVVAVLLGASCAAVLYHGAIQGVRSTAQLSSARSIDLAHLDDSFYSCLSDEARRLVPASAPVEIPRNPPGPWVVLAKAIDRWARLVPEASQAKVVLELRTGTGQGPKACLGDSVVAFPGGLHGRS